MEQEYDATSRTTAGQTLNLLCGLNRRTSKDGIVGSCDPKHIEKRECLLLVIFYFDADLILTLGKGFATLLRNESGIMVGDQHINAEIVLNHLCTLEGMTREKARELLNPADKQNVPKAVRLIQSLSKLEEIPDSPSQEKERRALIFLGKFLNSFVSPFADSTFSLSDQVASLVAYAHIAAVLYKRHQTACMTGALYADSQAAVKSIIFTIARMQEIEDMIRRDPSRDQSALPIKFFLGHEGTDRLEGLFGEARTHDHARNFDVLQLCQKLASSVIVSSTFERNPDIDPGHKRLKLKDMEGVDHTNPNSWDGDIDVRNVDLEQAWQDGRDLASEIIFTWDGSTYDFDSWFSQPEYDLLRPLGKYVGLDYKDDDMRTENEEELVHPILEPPAPTSTEDVEMQETRKASDGSSSDSSVGSPIESEPESGADPTPLPPNPSSNSPIDDSEDSDDNQSDLSPGFDIEDWLPESIKTLTNRDPLQVEFSRSPLQAVATDKNTSSRKPLANVLTKKGKKYLKSSVVASLCSKWSKKLTIRPLRVRGWSLENFVKQEVVNDNLLDDSGYVKRGDIAAVLCRANRQLALAVMQISGFRDTEGNSVSSISADALQSPESKIKVSGQILELVPDGNQNKQWKWNGRYIRIKKETAAHNAITTKNSIIRDIRGSFIYPLGPEIVRFDNSLSAGQLFP